MIKPDPEGRELVLLAVTGWRIDALGNMTLIGGPLGPDVQIQAADIATVKLAIRAAQAGQTNEVG